MAAHDHQLALDTTVIPTGSPARPGGVRVAPVPAAAGHAAPPVASAVAVSHPSRPRQARPPDRRGAGRAAGGEPIGRRTFDDLYLLGPRASPRAGGRRRLLDHAPLWTRVPVRPGVGTGWPTVRRAGADDGRHEQPRRRHDAARGTGRRVHRQVHARDRGSANERDGIAGPSGGPPRRAAWPRRLRGVAGCPRRADGGRDFFGSSRSSSIIDDPGAAGGRRGDETDEEPA